jgi:tRNA(Ile2) C34 agmatinyltransferase TiaS
VTDDRPPICPACGVTQGLVADGDDVEYVCLECGYSDARPMARDDLGERQA